MACVFIVLHHQLRPAPFRYVWNRVALLVQLNSDSANVNTLHCIRWFQAVYHLHFRPFEVSRIGTLQPSLIDFRRPPFQTHFRLTFVPIVNINCIWRLTKWALPHSTQEWPQMHAAQTTLTRRLQHFARVPIHSKQTLLWGEVKFASVNVCTTPRHGNWCLQVGVFSSIALTVLDFSFCAKIRPSADKCRDFSNITPIW